ncbi:hypothetical protein JVT61DRAFT_848 [Boletus reticuloceps]|uniref:Uncharacterized protein n=1 Tax=Boletus reticuloceps TaxID=495285 RepID=A0A8I2Z284_9AGAM|nr:hypothetical protein JVT61DRAFT_848 [Boletus reticuloceps]
MNVFLLDPPRRLLSAFVWVASSNTIGLYVLPDWAKDEYVFVDTGVGCLISSNWSCILHEDQIVIHSEEADAAYQHFYPLNILRNFIKPRKPSLLANCIHNHDYEPTNYDPLRSFCRDDLPVISIRLSPTRSISKKFVFPSAQPSSVEVVGPGPTTDHDVGDDGETSGDARSPSPGVAGQAQVGPSISVTSAEKFEEVNENDKLLDDGSESGTEDDDKWSLEAIAESLRPKGKGRADSEVTIDEYEPGPSSKRAKDKGKMRENDAEQEPGGETGQVQSSPASHQNSLSIAHSSWSASTLVPLHAPLTPSPAPNPYPFPPWYPESAHFVRQWWPTLPGVPRLSCTVVLLAAHDPDTHRTRFVLAQHYFRVPIVREPPTSNAPTPNAHTNEEGDDEMLHLWYVSTPFEVVCVLDGSSDNDDEEEAGDRPRPLVAVDFGHAVWIEYAAEPGGVYGVDASRLVAHAPFSDSEDDAEDEDDALFPSTSDDGSGSAAASVPNGTDPRRELSRRATSESTNPHDGDGTIYDPRRHRVPKCLRFVTFPPIFTAVDRKREKPGEGRLWREEAVVRTLEIPEELDLDGVETINIDQSQGAVILSVKEGKIFILRYE